MKQFCAFLIFFLLCLNQESNDTSGQDNTQSRKRRDTGENTLLVSTGGGISQQMFVCMPDSHTRRTFTK